jgi:hypothetical protein
MFLQVSQHLVGMACTYSNIKLFASPFLLLLAPAGLCATDLQPDTLKAWDDYVKMADNQLRSRLSGAQPFLWTDESSDRKLRVSREEIVVRPVLENGTKSVPNGLIHHWIGAIFIPAATIPQLSSTLNDYSRYKDIFKPAVADSRLLRCTDEGQEISMIWQRRVLFVNAAVEVRYTSRHTTLDPQRGYNIADTVQVREIQKYGDPGQQFLPPDTGSGFIWRLHSIARYQEREGGVYLELEAMALTRDIPGTLKWLVSPVVKHLSINSMATSLRETRDAIEFSPAGLERIDYCTKRP